MEPTPRLDRRRFQRYCTTDNGYKIQTFVKILLGLLAETPIFGESKRGGGGRIESEANERPSTWVLRSER